MQRVFCHSLGVTSEGKYSFEGLPPEKFEVYAKRAFVLAEKEDLVVVPPHQETKDLWQEIHILNESGLGPDPKNVMHAVISENGDAVLPNGAWKAAKHRKEGMIIPFTGKTSLPFFLAEKAGMPVFSAKESKVKILDGKDFFQNLALDCIPKGKVLRRESDVLNFFSRLNGDAWICKTSQNASGMSTCLVTAEERNEEAILSFVEEGKLPVMQEYLRHNISPSVNMDIDRNGNVSNLFLSGQILSLSPRGGAVHEGNIYPYKLPLAVKRYIMANSVKIAGRYSRAGYFGPLGVDWIWQLGSDSLPKAVEVNARVTAPRYPYRVMNKLGANSFCLQNVEFPSGMTPFQVRQTLDPVWFDKRKRKGVLFFNFNQSMGKMAVISLGKSIEESKEVMNEVTALL